MALYAGGQMEDYIRARGRFPDNVTLYYLHQMLDALEYMHGKGVCHRDLKPANILLSDHFDIKITDFGLASVSGKTNEFCGTLTFMAPEIWYGSYSTTQADIFALGVIIFYMFSGKYPFRFANHHDQRYDLIAQRKYDEFWRSFGSDVNFPTPFKDLLNSMLSRNPADRLSIKEIRAHSWVQGKIATPLVV